VIIMNKYKRVTVLVTITAVVLFSHNTFYASKRYMKAAEERGRRKQEEAKKRAEVTKQREEAAAKKRKEKEAQIKREEEQRKIQQKTQPIQKQEVAPTPPTTSGKRGRRLEETPRVKAKPQEIEEKKSVPIAPIVTPKIPEKVPVSPVVPPVKKREKPTLKTYQKVALQELTTKEQLFRCLKQGVLGCFAFFRELQGTSKVAAHMLLPMVVSSMLAHALKRGDMAMVASMFLLFGAKGGLRHAISLPAKIGTGKFLTVASRFGRWGSRITGISRLAKKLGSFGPTIPMPEVLRTVATGTRSAVGKLVNIILQASGENIVNSAYYAALHQIPGYTKLSKAIAPEPGEAPSAQDYRETLENILGPEIAEMYFPSETQEEQMPQKPKEGSSHAE
jgi:hypothetical protein